MRVVVVVVVVRELLFLVASVIYVRIRGYDNSVPLSSAATFLPEWIRCTVSTLFVT